MEAARDAGVNEFCSEVVAATEMLRKVAAIIDNPRPFSANYVGPDRRRRQYPD